MPRLYVDGSAISHENKGVGRYSYELCKRVSDRLEEYWEVDVAVIREQVPRELKEHPRLNLIATKSMSDFYRNVFWLPRQVRNRRYDVLLKPMESSGIPYRVPTVTVCHDVQELIDEAAALRPSVRKRMVNSVKRAFKSVNLQNSAVVICNSRFTQDAASHWYGFDREKSLVGYCGVNEKFFELSDAHRSGLIKRYYDHGPFILTFATGDNRENHYMLPEVLNELRRRGCKTKLVIAGIKEQTEYINKMDVMFGNYNLQLSVDYQYVGFLGEDRIEELVELYTMADFYLELSGHEGFGMQLAEAMACGTTCVSSGHGALSEVGAGFDIQLESLKAVDVARVIADSYKTRRNERDNRDQVSYVRTHYSWDVVADLVVQELNRHWRRTVDVRLSGH